MNDSDITEKNVLDTQEPELGEATSEATEPVAASTTSAPSPPEEEAVETAAVESDVAPLGENEAKEVAASADEFDVEAVSSSKPKKLTPLKTPPVDLREDADSAEPVLSEEAEKELSPIFKELAAPKLPSLPAENRAFLQMQSPNRIFFYWSIKGNPYETLHRGLGNRAENYQLIVKLVNLSDESEEFYPVQQSGSWWFNVKADSSYRAEVGFLAPNRPFIRLVFSNVLETPRSQPSTNRDFSVFDVTANQFAEVLEAAGFTQDAFDVYLAGDDVDFADNATQKAFTKIAGQEFDYPETTLNELRYVLFALASGVSLTTLRERISSGLFEFLAELTSTHPDALSEENVILALEEFFGINFADFAEGEIDEEYYSSAVYGASLINFPKGVRKHKSRFAPEKWDLAPISSAATK